MQHPQTICAFAVAVGVAGVKIDQYVLLQARNRALVAELQSPVIGGGAGGKHFDDQLRFGLDQRVGPFCGAARHHHVGIEILIGAGDVELHVAHVGAAEAAN